MSLHPRSIPVSRMGSHVGSLDCDQSVVDHDCGEENLRRWNAGCELIEGSSLSFPFTVFFPRVVRRRSLV